MNNDLKEFNIIYNLTLYLPLNLTITIILIPLKRKLLLFVSIVFGLFKLSFATIQIDSIHTTISTCPNNGTITVFASTDKPQMFYSIIDGPALQPEQTNNVFSSLPPGNYTIKVIDAASEIAIQKEVVIIGSYNDLSFNPIATSPYCSGSFDGKLIGNLKSGTGYAPYSWQLISPSAVTTVPQSSDTFKNLPDGDYTIRVADACGVYRTTNKIIPMPSDNSLLGFNSINKVGCDTIMLIFTVKLPYDTTNVQSLIKFKTQFGFSNLTIGNPSTIIDSSQIDSNSHTLIIKQLFPNLTYGDTINISLKNPTCSTTNNYTVQYDTYKFSPVYKKEFANCSTITTLVAYQFNGGNNGLKIPKVHYYLTDLTTNNKITDSTISSSTVGGVNYNGVSYFPVWGTKPQDTVYKFTVIDACGLVYTSTDTVPSTVLNIKMITAKQVYPGSCLDSVAAATITTVGFGGGAKLTLLSGPTSFGSTTPGYAYTNTISYPFEVFTSDGSFILKSLPAGKYVFRIEDTCGSLTDSFIVKTSDLGSLKFSNPKFQSTCSNKNFVYFTYSGEGTVGFRNLATGNYIELAKFSAFKPTVDTVLVNLPTGKYAMSYFFGANSSGTPIANKNACSTATNNVSIINYLPPSISSSNSIICGNNIEVEIIPDSSKGMPPFQYQIIKGPKTYPLQQSNVFKMSKVGIYTARIYDKCGNVSVTNITVDTLSFLPINSIASTCAKSLKLFYGSSIFYTYNWTKGTSFNYTGDTLNIPFITAADTGIYDIKAMVNINGCKDTLFSNYHLYGGNYFVRDVAICKGSSVKIGNHTYNEPGSYIDSLINPSGCDSIIKSNVKFITPKSKRISLSGCNTVFYNGNNYVVSTIYRDTLRGVGGCDSLYRIVDINIKPIVPKYINIAMSACDSVLLNGKSYYTNTMVKDTIYSDQGCDSLYRLVNIKIITKTTPTITVTGGIDSICNGSLATFIAKTKEVGNKPTFKWELNGVNVPARDSIFTSNALNNRDNIRCTVTSNAYCQTTSTAKSNVIKVVILPNFTPSINITANSDAVCIGNTVLFEASSTYGGNSPIYQWQINNRNAGTNIDTFESSTLRNGDNISCILTSNIKCPSNKNTKSNTITMSVSPGNCDTLYVPSAFNPFSIVNSYNKVLRPFSNGNTIKKLTFKVFNRYGKMVFESHDLSNAWDGKIDGIMQESDTFVWTLIYTKLSGKEIFAKGIAVLIH